MQLPTELLSNLAEVSATFAGFTVLVTLFARKRVQGGAAHDLLRLRLVIGANIVVVMAALTPIAVTGMGLSQTLTWQLCALAFLALIGFLIGNFVMSYKTVRGSFPPDRLAATVALVLAVPVYFALVSILFSATATHQTFYVAALIGTLGQASFVFLRLVESTFTNIVYQPTTAASTL
ncbi:MAG: hypothetical protein P8L31_04620 [Pseudomonadales bacterium]|nr:hypothetical protein [Pseudomonadales bacterium]